MKKEMADPEGICTMISNKCNYKSFQMIGFFILLWVLLLILCMPQLWQILIASKNIIEFVLLLIYCLVIMFFWMLAAYYISVVLFSFFPTSSHTNHTDLTTYKNKPPQIALLYCTCNDFQIEAATTCLKQNYENFHLFLLDDSAIEEFRTEVDNFHNTSGGKTTIIRRLTHHGFKAGNLNNALHKIPKDYEFFVVLDADEKLPSDFLQQTLSHMIENPCIAFVQANHVPNPQQDSAFARDIGPTLLSFWDVHCRPRNRYGLVLYLGHGVLVRRSAWEAVGGFPEVVLEDLAFSIVLREKGMRGEFLENLVCYEDFPSNYLVFKRQHERYIIGTTQVMHKYLKFFLKSKKVSLTEKIDFCLWCSPLYTPALCLFFIALSSLGITVVFGNWQSPVITLWGCEFILPIIRVLDSRFAPLLTWDFQLLAVICSLSPAFSCLALGIKRKLRPLRLLFLSTATYLSLMIVSWRGILGYLFLNRTFSPSTGDLTLFNKKAFKSPNMEQRFLSKQKSTWHSPKIWEGCIGGLLIVTSLTSFNFAFAAISFCLILGICIEVFGWERRMIQVASVSCFAVIILQMLANIIIPASSLGLVPLMFSVHF